MSHSAIQTLVEAHAVLYLEKQGDGTLGHISVRSDDGRGFWIKRADLTFDEVVDENSLQLLSYTGEILRGDGPKHSEWPIHAEILVRRKEIRSVAHTHSVGAALLAASNETIRPYSVEGGYFSREDVPIFHAPTAHIDDRTIGEDMCAAMGNSNALLIKNHGIVACGPTIPFVTFVAIALDRAAAIQLQAARLRDCKPAAKQEMASRAAMLDSPSFLEQAFQALVRRVARQR